MTATPPTTILARCNGVLLVETPRGVALVEQGGGWIGTALFVSILVGVISLGGTVIATVAGGPLGLVVAVVPALCALLTSVFLEKRRALRAATTLPAPFVELLTGKRLVVTHARPQGVPFADVRVERVFQAGSSSKALALLVPDKLIVARGTPFGDGVHGLENELRRRLAN